MRLLFGDEFDYDRLGLAMVAAGMGLYLSATTVNQAVLAQGRAPLAAGSWAASAAFFVAFLLIASMEEVREVEVAFLATAAVLSALLYLAYRSAPDPERRIRPRLHGGARSMRLGRRGLRRRVSGRPTPCECLRSDLPTPR